jgi:DNA-binding GntR family transcriptional regulator
MDANGEYKYLKPKRGSHYQQLFFGRIRAEILYRETVGREPLTPEEVAREYQVPVEAVREAIQYCTENKELLDAERAREQAQIVADGRDKWPYAPKTAPARV